MSEIEFLTPPDIPEGEDCRTLKIPNSLYWLGVFNSALLDLTNPAKWKQVNDTDLTPDEAAEKCYEIYEAYIASGTDCAMPPTIPLTNVYGHWLDTGESAGDTSSNTAYTRSFPNGLVSETAEVEKDEDDQTFHLQPGYWHIRAVGWHNGTGQTEMRIVDCTGTPMILAYGVSAAARSPEVEAWVYITSGTRDICIDQYFRLGATDGLGLMDGTHPGYVALVYFDYSPTKPGV